MVVFEFSTQKHLVSHNLEPNTFSPTKRELTSTKLYITKRSFETREIMFSPHHNTGYDQETVSTVIRAAFILISMGVDNTDGRHSAESSCRKKPRKRKSTSPTATKNSSIEF
jgi:hypothetical protein